ncbi:hypothetical protein [Antribacter gilvus]|uniref:hypothetical protein n=1 Tax=Antribacter gilvus TaxID=2304675 RepID=UPI000F78EDF8|nr:hypothetical protein [Antribacter gilvus]
MKKLLSRPVLQRVAGVAGVAALAVTSAFVAGALAGGDPAPEATSEPWAGAASSGTETVAVPVLAPAATGPEAPPPPAEGDDVPEPVTSEVTGFVDVPLPPGGDFAEPDPAATTGPADPAGTAVTSADPSMPGDPTAPPAAGGDPTAAASGSPSGPGLFLAPEVLATLAGLAEAADPGTVAGVSALDPVGDPCATGAEATGCPGGVQSTVLASTDLPPLTGYSLVRPPVGGPDSAGLMCPERETGPDRVQFAVGTNLPVELRVSYWPEGRPTEARRILTWTGGEERDRFVADPPHPSGGPYTVLKHCTVLDRLEPGVVYEVESVATTESGEQLRIDDLVLPGAELGRPPSRVLTVGQNVVFASLAHTTAEQAELVAYRVAPEDPLDCDPEDRGTRARLARLAEPSTVEVPAETLQRGGFGLEFNRRTSVAFLASEGTQVVVCLTAVDRSRASFEGRASSLESVVLSTPDRLLPVITWHRATVHPGHGIEQVRVGVSTRNAGRCAQLTRDPRLYEQRTFEIEAPTGGSLCDQSDLDGTSGVVLNQTPVLWARVDGNGGSYTARAALPVAGFGCDAGCRLPEVEWYTLSLERPRDGGTICGSSFGGCDEPTPRAAGSVLIRVEWVHGSTNGQQDWAVGPLVQHVGTPVLAELPQLDTRMVPAFDSAAGAITVDLRTDRPAAYRAEILGECDREGRVTLLEGRIEGTSRLTFANVCSGTTYEVAVTLTDNEGRVAAYGTDQRPPRYWNAVLRTPGFPATVRGSVTVRQGDGVDGPETPTMLLEPFSLKVDGVQLMPHDYREGYCTGATGVALLDHREVDLADLVHVQAEVTVRDGGATYDPTRSYQRCPAWSAPAGDSRPAVVDALVPLDSLRSPDGVDVTAQDASGEIEVRVHLALAP